MDDFARAFEERFRGDKSMIASRLNGYAAIFEPVRALTAGECRSLDLGCGRGEFVELLANAGFAAEGVELDPGLVELGQQEGLAVRHGDVVEALQAAQDESYALISAIHVVEHIPFERLRELVEESFRVLVPGGLLILETPNSNNPHVGLSTFYLDPTHQTPIPSHLLAFVVEQAGFARNAVRRLHPMRPLEDLSDVGLSDVFETVGADYAVIAQKSGAGEIWTGLDEAFQAEPGPDLTELTARFDNTARASQERIIAHLNQVSAQLELLVPIQQELRQLRLHENRIAELAAEVAEQSRRIAELTEQLHAKDQQLDAQQSELNSQQRELNNQQDRLNTQQNEVVAQQNQIAAQQDQITTQHDQLAAQYEQLQGILNSRSWRLTAPLRRSTEVPGPVPGRASGWRSAVVGRLYQSERVRAAARRATARTPVFRARMGRFAQSAAAPPVVFGSSPDGQPPRRLLEIEQALTRAIERDAQ